MTGEDPFLGRGASLLRHCSGGLHRGESRRITKNGRRRAGGDGCASILFAFDVVFLSVISPCVFVHGPAQARQDVIGLLKTSGDESAIESRVGGRERSVFISVPQGLKVGGQFTLNPGSQEDSAFVAGLSNPMKDNDALDWVNDNEVTVFLKSVRNNASKGRVGLNEVMEVEKGIVIRELAFCLSEGFDDRVVGPEDSPWQRARVVSSGGDIKMR